MRDLSEGFRMVSKVPPSYRAFLLFYFYVIKLYKSYIERLLSLSLDYPIM
jgi:hypothetical protein